MPVFFQCKSCDSEHRLPASFVDRQGLRRITDGGASVPVPNNRRHDTLPQNRLVLARGRSTRRASPRQ
jgi:hypothetical protein